MTTHHPKCLCWNCEKLPEHQARIKALAVLELTARGEMTGLRRHWMEQAQAEATGKDNDNAQ